MIPESAADFAARVFALIDQRDARAFAELFREGGQFRFGNAPVCVGVDAIRDFVGAFFAALESLEHRIDAVHAGAAGTWYFHVQVRYCTAAGSTDWIPALVYAEGDASGFSDYQIFCDPAPLQALLG
jgi:hypothetical protein